MTVRALTACAALGALLLVMIAPASVEAQRLQREGRGDYYDAYVPDVDGDGRRDLASCLDFNVSGPGTLCLNELTSGATIATVYTVIRGVPHILRGELQLRRVSPTREVALPSTLETFAGPLDGPWTTTAAHDHLTDHNWQLEIEGVTQG